jgi:hypothetical protein
MGLIYSTNKSATDFEEFKVKIEDDFVEIRKPEKPILFLDNYMTIENFRIKKKLPIIYESSEDENDCEYDIDSLEQDKKLYLDDVFGI